MRICAQLWYLDLEKPIDIDHAFSMTSTFVYLCSEN